MKWKLTNYQRDYILHERDRIFRGLSTFEESNKLVWEFLEKEDSFMDYITSLVWETPDKKYEETWRVNFYPKRIQYVGFIPINEKNSNLVL